jgi:hypothetical protein
MQYYIKEWSDRTASLIAEDGYALDIFDSIDEAIDACIYDCMVEPEYIERHNSYLGASPLDVESGFCES